MVTRRVPQAQNTFDRPYIWPGLYLAKMIEIKEFRDDGNRFETTFTNPDGSVNRRDALVLVFELIQPVGPDPDLSDGSSTKEDRLGMVGETIGKKVTDTLSEKGNLYAYFTAITGNPPRFDQDVQLDDMLESLCVIKVVDNSKPDGAGGTDWRSYVQTVMPHIEIPPVTAKTEVPPRGDSKDQVPRSRPTASTPARSGRVPATASARRAPVRDPYDDGDLADVPF